MHVYDHAIKWRCILDHDGGSKVNCRTTNERPTFIDRAASIRGVTRTEFVLRLSEAAAALNERPALDDETYDAFVIALDAPVKSGPNLKERFACSPSRKRYPRQRQLTIGTAFRGSTNGALGPNAWLRSKAERGQGRCTNLCDLLRRESNRVLRPWHELDGDAVDAH